MLTRFSKWILLGCIVSLLISLQLFNLQTSQAAAKSTISFYVFGDLAEKAAYQTLVTAFNAKYPDITVNMVYTQGEDEFHSLNGEDEYRSRLSLDFERVEFILALGINQDRKSTRLNSSHTVISYAVFCL